MLGPAGLPVTWQKSRIYLYGQNVDMRRSFNGLCAIVQAEFHQDIRAGHLFVFLNRRRDRVKLLWWDRDGCAIWMKLLQRGTFQRPNVAATSGGQVVIDETDLTLLLTGIDVTSAKRRPRYVVADQVRAALEAALESPTT